MNTMPLAMANATGIPIIIFSLEIHGIFRVDPESISMFEAMVLSYHQYGLGHYDTIKLINSPAIRTPHLWDQQESLTGVGCTNVIGQYSTCCKRYKSRQPCTVACGYKNCCNYLLRIMSCNYQPSNIENQSLTQGSRKTSETSVSVYGGKKRKSPEN